MGTSTQLVENAHAVADAQVIKSFAPQPSKHLQSEAAKVPKNGMGLAKAQITGEVLAPSELENIVHAIENLEELEAKKLVDKLRESAEFTFFELGGVLSVIRDHGWYAPYGSFPEFCEGHGIHYRKAMYFVSIYNRLVEAKVPSDDVKEIGWTKLRILAPVLTPDNAVWWLSLAKEQTATQLGETIKAHKQGATKLLEDHSSSKITIKTFKLHDDQKATVEAAIEKAKEQLGASSDTAAFELICLDFLGNVLPSLKDQIQAAGPDAAAAALKEVFPHVGIQLEQSAC
jgi:hypothetical protein